MGVQIIGLSQCLADLDQLGARIEHGTDQAINEAGEECMAGAKSRARVDTGAMRNAIRHEHKKLSSSVISPVDHSVFNEFGTVKMSAQPFMRPSHRIAVMHLQQKLKAL